ncbi:hypothetical protein ACFLZ4_02695, partial [Patescibacteria group bacterium]
RIEFWDDTTDVIALLNANVGIGTTSPSYTLDVNGTLNMTTLYVNGEQVLASGSELSLLDGATLTLAELNLLDGRLNTLVDSVNVGTYATTGITAGSGLTGGAGSGPATLNLAGGAGMTVTEDGVTIDATTTSTTSISSANSGLEVTAGGLRLLGGCSDDQVLAWEAGTSEWICKNTSSLSGVGDITAVGSMTSGDVFANTAASDEWIGLGANAGRIYFEDRTIDEINFLGAKVGIGTSDPSALLDVYTYYTSDPSGTTLNGAEIKTTLSYTAPTSGSNTTHGLENTLGVYGYDRAGNSDYIYGLSNYSDIGSNDALQYVYGQHNELFLYSSSAVNAYGLNNLTSLYEASLSDVYAGRTELSLDSNTIVSDDAFGNYLYVVLNDTQISSDLSSNSNNMSIYDSDIASVVYGNYNDFYAYNASMTDFYGSYTDIYLTGGSEVTVNDDVFGDYLYMYADASANLKDDIYGEWSSLYITSPSTDSGTVLWGNMDDVTFYPDEGAPTISRIGIDENFIWVGGSAAATDIFGTKEFIYMEDESTADEARNAYYYVYPYGNASITTAYGVQQIMAPYNTATITTGYGYKSQIMKGAGTATLGTTYNFFGTCDDATTCYGLYLDTADDTPTTNYGIYLTAGSASSDSYGIWADSGDWVLDEDGDGTPGGTGAGGELYLGDGQDLELYHDGTNSYVMNNTGQLFIGDAGTDDVILSYNGGNVGIGTSDPSYRLDVSGSTNTASLFIAGQEVLASGSELSLLDGATLTLAELNILDGVTADATEINLLDGVNGVLVSSSNVDTYATTGVTAGSGLTGGGLAGVLTLDINLGSDLAFDTDAVTLTTTGVSAGSYGTSSLIPQILVDSK